MGLKIQMMTRMTLLLGLGILASAQAFSADTPPSYYRYGSPICYSSSFNGETPTALPVNDPAVLQLKANSPEGYKVRAHVEGPIVRLFNDATGHNHFEIQIGPNPTTDVLEVIYNQDFGALPQLELGMTVEACGDYITSRQQDGPYPPSPAGAIIHWVHENPSGHGHPSGFLIIQGHLYGNSPVPGANPNQ